MVSVKKITETRPRISSEFDMGEFQPRTEAIAKAYRIGQEMHAGQQRMSGEPYFETHCVWVAGFLDSLVENEAWTIAALLHDAVEDRGNPSTELKLRSQARSAKRLLTS